MDIVGKFFIKGCYALARFLGLTTTFGSNQGGALTPQIVTEQSGMVSEKFQLRFQLRRPKHSTGSGCPKDKIVNQTAHKKESNLLQVNAKVECSVLGSNNCRKYGEKLLPSAKVTYDAVL